MAHVGSRKLTLDIDGDDVSPDVSTVEITSEETDSDFVSFASAAAGGSRTYLLHLVLAQDMATDSLWSQIWDHAGEEVDFTVMPDGAGGATFTGTCVIKEPDGVLLGGEADPSTTAVFTVEVEWECLAKPVKTP